MVNVDLSKVLPARVHDHLAGIVPGLFFVFSVAIANPELADRLAANASRGLAIGYYVRLGITLFLAFVIGEGFIILVALLQFFFCYVYRVKLFLYRRLCKWPLRHLMMRILRKPRWQRVSALQELRHRIDNVAFTGFENEWRDLQGCWSVLANRLIKVRYGLESDAFENGEWGVLYANLGKPTPEDLRGFMALIICHATGWAGLVATRIAPTLRNRYYVGFCVFLVLNGMLHDYYVAKRRVDPRVNPTIAIRAILREFPQLGKEAVQPTEPNA